MTTVRQPSQFTIFFILLCISCEMSPGNYRVMKAEQTVAVLRVHALPAAGGRRELRFLRSGTINRVMVQPGMLISKGDTLVTLDSREAWNNVKHAETAVELARLHSKDLKETDRVIAEQQLTKARLAESSAGKRIEAVEELYRQGGVTSRVFDSLKTVYAQTKADRIIKESRYSSILLNKPAVLKAALRQAVLALEQARTALSGTVLRAPVSGRVMEVYRSPGEILQNGEPVLHFIPEEKSGRLFKARITQYEASFLRAGMTATVKTLSDGSVTQATVTAVIPSGNQTRNMDVFFLADTPLDKTISSGVVLVETIIDTFSTALVLEPEFLHGITEQGTAFVALGKKGVKTPVTCLPEGTGRYIVRSGLKEGDTVFVLE